MYLPESRITLLATENAFSTSVLMFSSFSHVSAELSYPYTSHTYARLVVTLVTVSVSVSVPRMSKTLQYNCQRLFMSFWCYIFLIRGVESIEEGL